MPIRDRKSTRLNSSHVRISYAVLCLETKKSPSTALFFFNDTATTEIYTLSLHDALPISRPGAEGDVGEPAARLRPRGREGVRQPDRHLPRGHVRHPRYLRG